MDHYKQPNSMQPVSNCDPRGLSGTHTTQTHVTYKLILHMQNPQFMWSTAHGRKCGFDVCWLVCPQFVVLTADKFCRQLHEWYVCGGGMHSTQLESADWGGVSIDVVRNPQFGFPRETNLSSKQLVDACIL